MAQHDYTIENQVRQEARLDINAGFQALLGDNAGDLQPDVRFPFMKWADTTTGLLKRRNAANNAWLIIGPITGIHTADRISGRVDTDGTLQDLTLAQVRTLISTATETLSALVRVATEAEGVAGVETGAVVPDVATVKAMVATHAPATGYASMQVFTASGTWTKPSGIRLIEVIVTGGGNNGINAYGGLAAGTAIKVIDVSNVSTVAVTIGAAGSVSSFGSYCTGGVGAGDTVGGDLNLPGGEGVRGFNVGGYTGGASYWGGGGGFGSDARAYGAGGGSNSSGSNFGAGKSGVCVIREYY